ncbi:substrate import-associated zinc metallohydrolase lipoprotein [Chitinophaga lutea]
MKHLTISLLLIAAFAGCRKDDGPGNVDNIPGLGGDTWAQGPIDVWIKDSLTAPLNISVKYKWDQGELDPSRTLVPPMEDKILPVLSTVRRAWIKPYEAEAGELFMKKYTPKYFVLVGSSSYNLDGTIILGQAEGGRTIQLYALNNFRVNWMPGYQPSDSFNVIEMFHTIHHEFAHILNQNIAYPVEYKRISVGQYTSSWNLVSEEEASRRGFVSSYAMAAPDEDFVEMVSMMMVMGKSGFDNFVNGITEPATDGTTPAQARARLRQKESMVVDYYRTSWGINYYNLQLRSRAALVALIK